MSEQGAGGPEANRPTTLGGLRQSGYTTRSVREEMRRNLLGVLQRGERLLPGIIGFDEFGDPGDRERAAGRPSHGLPRRARPGEIAHHPRPARRCSTTRSRPCAAARCTTTRFGRSARRAASAPPPMATRWRSSGSAAPRATARSWRRPIPSIADLIGEVDPIKVAEGRYLADEDTIHYGLIPRSNRGIFAINELPDLTEKVQVGLFNLMEEKDVQIKGYRIMLPLDVVIVASANPEDYTSRGRIITPLKDRFDVQIRTHYPRALADEIAIMEQELPVVDRAGRAVHMPEFPQGDPRPVHLRGARLPGDQPVVGRQRAGDDQQLRERAEQRREARRPPRRTGDRAAPQRPARPLRLDRRQDRDRVRRRGAQRERHHRAADQPRRAGGVRSALHARRPGADRRPLRGRLGRRGQRHDAAPRTISRACRRFPGLRDAVRAPRSRTKAPASSPPPPSWSWKGCTCTRSSTATATAARWSYRS